MTTLVFASTVRARAEHAYDWHASGSALRALTPWWTGARVVREAPSLAPGARAILRLGVGPVGILWIAEHYREDRPREFAERQISGPFARWDHRHQFLPVAGDPELTIVRDEVRYELRFGAVGRVVDVLLVRPFLRHLFAHRHRVTQVAVEGDRFFRRAS